MNTQFLLASEGQIAYDDTGGAGPVIICVPGLGDVRAEYRFLIPELRAAGYRVVTMDVRGHGETSVTWPDYSVTGVGADILTLAKYLNAGPVTVIGTSMAAGAGVWAAAESPQAIQSLIVIGPFVRENGPRWKQRALSMLFNILFSGPWGSALWGRYYSSLYPTVKPTDLTEYVARLRANLDQPGRLRAMRKMISATKDASEVRLSRVKVPVLVVMGSKDPDFSDPAEEARLVGERLHGEVRIIEGAGHYPHAEMPSLTAPLIMHFLKQAEAISHGA